MSGNPLDRAVEKVDDALRETRAARSEIDDELAALMIDFAHRMREVPAIPFEGTGLQGWVLPARGRRCTFYTGEVRAHEDSDGMSYQEDIWCEAWLALGVSTEGTPVVGVTHDGAVVLHVDHHRHGTKHMAAGLHGAFYWVDRDISSRVGVYAPVPALRVNLEREFALRSIDDLAYSMAVRMRT